MTRLVGKICDSIGNPVNNVILTIKLNAPITQTSTTPDTQYTTKPAYFRLPTGDFATVQAIDGTSITGGINLVPTNEATYSFSGTYESVSTVFYLDGKQYGILTEDGKYEGGFYHKHTDNKYYAGEVHSADSKLLDTFNRKSHVELFEPFNAHIANQTDMEWGQLQHSNINTSNIDTSAYYIAELLGTTHGSSIANKLFVAKGEYNVSTTYQKGDIVSHASSNAVYWYINDVAGSGKPPTDTAYWMKLFQGSTGGGGSTITLLDAPFDATWNGNINQPPTANVLYDQMIKYALLTDATFQALKAPTLPATTNTTDVATTAMVQSALSAFVPPLPTTAPDISLDDISTKIVNSKSLKAIRTRIAIAEERVPQSGDGGAITGGFKNRIMGFLPVNKGNAVAGISGGYVQLAPGKYFISGKSAVCGVDKNRVVLVDSAGNFLALGLSGHTENRTYQLSFRGNYWGEVSGYVETSVNLNVTLRHYAETVGNSADSGKASGFAGQEIMAQMVIHRLE